MATQLTLETLQEALAISFSEEKDWDSLTAKISKDEQKELLALLSHGRSSTDNLKEAREVAQTEQFISDKIFEIGTKEYLLKGIWKAVYTP